MIGTQGGEKGKPRGRQCGADSLRDCRGGGENAGCRAENFLHLSGRPSAPLTSLFAGLARNSDFSERSPIKERQNARAPRLQSRYGRMPDTSLLRSHFEYALGS